VVGPTGVTLRWRLAYDRAALARRSSRRVPSGPADRRGDQAARLDASRARSRRPCLPGAAVSPRGICGARRCAGVRPAR